MAKKFQCYNSKNRTNFFCSFKMKSFLLYILFISLSIGQLISQARLQVGTLPALTISKELKKDWQLTSKIENRLFFYDDSGLEKKTGLDYIHTDVAFIGSKKVGLSNQLSAGFQFRFGTVIEKRSIQQFNMVIDYYSFQLAHRFAADQTFAPDTPDSYRFRYRFTYNKPLSGNEINAKEFYFKAGIESLFILEENTQDLEFRGTPTIGYNFKSTNKIELGLDYRTDGILIQPSRQRYFVVLNYYVKL